jgi:hypothetical protein
MVLSRKKITAETLALLGGFLLVAFAGCGLFLSRDEGLVFNHEVHAAKGISCDGCHADYETEAWAGMPTYETCLTCHGPKSDRQAYAHEVEIQKHSPEDAFKAEKRYHDLKFSHAVHQSKAVPCADCHGPVASSIRLGSANFPTAEACIQCHKKSRHAPPAGGGEAAEGTGGAQVKDIAADCSVCHETQRRNVPPRTHAGNLWARNHGRDPSLGLNDRGHKESCQLCHAQSTCDGCHRVEKPLDHTEYFRIRGHGAYVSISRERCMACHQENFCVRCHQETRPRSHYVSTWGGSSSRHCLSCHLDFSDSGCFVCHKSAPSHREAPPRPPPPHASATADCRRCHLPRPPMHADNGSSCTACHR